MTDTLFPVDQQANDQLVLQEGQRKQDLINQAVESFAPHLSGKPGVKVIHIYSTNASLRKFIRDEVAGSRTIVVEHSLDDKERKGVNQVSQNGVFLELPKKADIVATKSNLNSKVEGLGARLGAQCVVLPEAVDWLAGVLEKSQVLIIVGGEQARW